MSRVFNINRHGVKTSVTVPIVDLCNTRDPYNSNWDFDNNKNGFVLFAMEDIKAGEQIFDN